MSGNMVILEATVENCYTHFTDLIDDDDNYGFL